MKNERDIRECRTDGVPNEIIIARRPTTDGERVLQIARHCEGISKRGGDHAKEYHRIAQHLKKSAGHLLALERNGEK